MSDLRADCAVLRAKIDELCELEKRLKGGNDSQSDERFLQCFRDDAYASLLKKYRGALSDLESIASGLAPYSATDQLRTEFARLIELRSILSSKEYHLLQLLAALGVESDVVSRTAFGNALAPLEDEYSRLKSGLSASVKNSAAFEKECGLKKRTIRGAARNGMKPGGIRQETQLSASDFSVGKTVTMGNYGGEPIEWLVLEADGDKRTMIAVKGQDAICFNKKRSDGNEWGRSYIRTWLNETYYNKAFIPEEKAIIVAGPTGDRVWLLSVDEAKKYFADDGARVCRPTEYAKRNGAWVWDKNGAGWWWLRSPGSRSDYAARVYDRGYVYSSGYLVDRGIEVARPVVRVSLGLSN